MTQDVPAEKLQAFLADLAALTIKHGLKITRDGYCGCASPSITPTTDTTGRYNVTCWRSGEVEYLKWEGPS